MIAKQEVFEGLYGAWRLLLGDRGAVALFDDSIPGFWKSFFAAALVLPIYVILIAMGVIDFESSRSLPAVILIDLEFYVIGWVLWPLVVGQILPALDRDEKFTIYVVAYNWGSAVGAGLFFLVILATTILPVPEAVGGLLAGMVSLGLLIYHIFIAHTTLSIPLGGAIGLTIAEFILGQIVLVVQQGVLA